MIYAPRVYTDTDTNTHIHTDTHGCVRSKRQLPAVCHTLSLGEDPSYSGPVANLYCTDTHIDTYKHRLTNTHTDIHRHTVCLFVVVLRPSNI